MKRTSRRDLLRVLVLGATLAWSSCGSAPPPPAPWIELFDGRSLGAFASTDFGGQGEVTVHDGRLLLGIGSPLTGVTWTGAPPAGDYELEVVARRELGSDFFAAITFPVGADHLTLVLGGWGGGLCGLSSLDGADASRNETRTHRNFTPGTDVHVHVAVDTERITASLDGTPLLQVEHRGRRLGLRPEVALCRPFGIASFATASSIAQIRWRPLRP